jgi:ParB-like chromosome segregation protein Spo0J
MAAGNPLSDPVVGDRAPARTPKVRPPGKPAGPDPQGQPPIPFAAIEISRWNAAKNLVDEAHVAELGKSIQEHGLLQGIVLVPIKDLIARFAAVAGAHRLSALIRQRGVDSALAPHEYTVRYDLNEDDPRCLRISTDENLLRRGMSVIRLATFVKRLIEKEKQPRKDVAKVLRQNEATISRLKLLPSVYQKLPQGWRDDLAVSVGDTSHTVAITLGHWAAVAATIEEKGVDKVRDILEQCHKHQWPVSRLDQALKGLKQRKITARDSNAGKRDARAKPRYQSVLRGLQLALRWTGKDDALAKQVEALIGKVKSLADKRVPRKGKKVHKKAA